MKIRPESDVDRSKIHAVHAAAFPTELEANIVDALRRAGRLAVSLVAEIGDEIVGHVAFSPVTLAGVGNGLGLGPVAVLPGSRRQGIAEKLIRDGLEVCRADGCSFVVVLGEPGYYGRFGFKPASHWKLEDEYGGGDAFQAFEVKDGSIPIAGGLVKYADEFNIAE